MIAPVMNRAFATDNGWAKICRWTLIHVCTMCTEKEDLLTVYFWVWREGLRRQLHLLHCMQLNGRNLWKQIFWTSGHQCCKESWQNGMKSRHSQETVIKFALEGRKVAPANTCRCVYGCRGTVWESHIPPYWEWASTVSGLLYISLCTFQILWNPTWLVQKHKETYKHYGSCVWYTHTHTLLLLLNLFYWIITDTQHYIFSGTLLSDSVFLYITPWSPWQV